MDKNEYRAKLDVINDLVDRQDYKGALEIVDTIDWRRVRSARTLCMVGEIYEANKRYEDSRKQQYKFHIHDECAGCHDHPWSISGTGTVF